MRNRLMIGAVALLLPPRRSRARRTSRSRRRSRRAARSRSAAASRARDGDEARYERYRDLQDGVNANFLYKKETGSWNFDFLAKNVGYRDQRYQLFFNSSRVKFNATFDQTPLNYSYYSRTPYNCTAGNCSLSSDLRTSVQAGQAVGIPHERRPAGQRLGLQLDRERLRPAAAPRHDQGRPARLGYRQPGLHLRREQLQALRQHALRHGASRSTTPRSCRW